MQPASLLMKMAAQQTFLSALSLAAPPTTKPLPNRGLRQKCTLTAASQTRLPSLPQIIGTGHQLSL